ncbi:hypothetical protein [Glycomyces sp. NPDC048151]|uniref:hypothetical protein n=1 Tax=Glycomyces sp. NPDC048151 TaxID=3364002 RepID=UPI0037223DFE
MRKLHISLTAATALTLAGCGLVDAVTGKQEYGGIADTTLVYWESAPEKVDIRGQRLDEPVLDTIAQDSTFTVLCALHAEGTDYYKTEQTVAEGWSDYSWEAWVYADGVRLRSGEDYLGAGEVPDDIKTCRDDEPETVAGPEAPDVHHRAFVVPSGDEEWLYLGVSYATFNGMGGDFEHIVMPGRAEIDVHCVRTTTRVTEEPGIYLEEKVPNYLATYDGVTGYVDPLWVYFAEDPAEVPASLDYDAQTGTVSDHGDVPDLQECPD